MAVGLGKQVVAEGVEDQVQRAFLNEQRCNAAQEYLFCRPLTADAFTLLLTKGLDATVAQTGDAHSVANKVRKRGAAMTRKAHGKQRQNTEATQ